MTLLERPVAKLVTKVDDVRTICRAQTDAQLDRRLEELRKSDAEGGSRRGGILPEGLGIITELARRTLEEQPIAYKCQLITAVHLLQRRIVELPNGEGKTLACALAAAYTAYFRKPCHIATYNSYLAKRDLMWMGPLYLRLGLKPCAFLDSNAIGFFDAAPDTPVVPPGALQVEGESSDEIQLPASVPQWSDVAETLEIRGRQYQLRVIPGAVRGSLSRMNVVYGTITDFIFRHLHDNLAYSADELAFPELACLIIDECDFALIDSADRPHKIVNATFDFEERTLRAMVPDLLSVLSRLDRDTDYDPLSRFRLTPEGERKVREAFGWGPLLSVEHSGVAALIDEMVWGLYGLRPDVDYVTADGEIKPIDAATGRPRSGATFVFGAHQALMLKHGMGSSSAILDQTASRVQGEISVQHFVRSYQHVCGLSASAMWYAREFSDLYGLNAVEVKPQFPSIRVDQDDIAFWTRYEKFVYLVDLVLNSHERGQPILVDCPDIRTAELIWYALSAQDIDTFATAHGEFLRFAEEDVMRLGLPRPGVVATVDRNGVLRQFERLAAMNLQPELLTAKNLALEAQVIADAGRPGAVTVSAKLAGRGTDIRVDPEADARGGLFVIGFDRNTSRHIDQQVRGRTGRQGRKGTSLFLLSLQDEVMVQAMNPRMRSLVERFPFEQGEQVKAPFLNSSVEAAQRRLTRLNARDRYETFRFDAVMDRHRAFLMTYRRSILQGQDFVPNLAQMIRNIIVRNVDAHLKSRDSANNSQEELLIQGLLKLGLVSRNDLKACIDEDKNRTIAKFGELFLGAFDAGIRRIGAAQFRERFAYILLPQISTMWSRYLVRKQEIYNQLATAGALGWQGGVSFEQYELELNTTYWREISVLEEQAIIEAFRLIGDSGAEANAQTPVAQSLPASNETSEDASRTRRADPWVRFRPLAIRTVSLEMLREIASEALAARDLLPVFGSWLLLALSSFVQIPVWDVQRIAEVVPVRSEMAALLGFTVGPALFCGGLLLLGAFPLLVFAGYRAFLPQPLRPAPFLLWLPYSIVVSAALSGFGAVKVDDTFNSLTYLGPLALLLLLVNLLDPLKTVRVGLAGFLLQSAPVALIMVTAATFTPSWLPFLGICCVAAIGLYVGYYFHNVLTKFWHVSLWRVQTFFLSLLVFYELLTDDAVLNTGVALAVAVILLLANRRIATLSVFIDVVDLSSSQPRAARHAIQLPHKTIYFLTAAATVGLAGVLTATFWLLGRSGLVPSITGNAAMLIWPMAVALVGAHFLVNQRSLLWVNKLLSRHLLRELQRRYTILKNSDGERDAGDRLAHEFLSSIRRVFFVSLCAFLVVWGAGILAPRISGSALQFPLGIGGFVIVCGFFSDSLLMFFRRLLARIQVRNADQALVSPGFSGPPAIALKPVSMALLERQRALLEEFWSTERRDKLLFVKQLMRLARSLGALPELKLTPGELVLSIVFRSVLLTVILGLAFQLFRFAPVRPEALQTWFSGALTAGILLVVLLSVLEYRGLKRKENQALADGELSEDDSAEQADPGLALRKKTPQPTEPKRTEMKTHVFLSYCRENKAEVARLRSDLVAAGEAVWWDDDILPGSDWKAEIRKAMKNSYAVVLCLSKEAEARKVSGIYPEILDAIATLREYAPGSVFLIPVRLSECEIPPIEIDSTRTLDRLHVEDLFPAEKRSEGIARLIRAVQAAPLHSKFQ